MSEISLRPAVSPSDFSTRRFMFHYSKCGHSYPTELPPVRSGGPFSAATYVVTAAVSAIMPCTFSYKPPCCAGDPTRHATCEPLLCYRTRRRASGTNVAAIDNKIEQAMDLVKSHLMYAVREEVEVLKEQIKELYERNSVLERENAVLKSLANSEQLSQLSNQSATSSGTTPPQQGLSQPQPQQAQPPLQVQPQSQLQQHPKPQQLDPGQQQLQPNVTSA